MMWRVRSAAAPMKTSGEAISLPARGVVLADPGLVVAELVEPLDQLHVAGHGQRGVLADPVERRQEDAELQAFVVAGLCH